MLCPCRACHPNPSTSDVIMGRLDPITGQRATSRLIVCQHCGLKRCPHAANHRNDCTASNATGQRGSHDGLIDWPTPVHPGAVVPGDNALLEAELDWDLDPALNDKPGPPAPLLSPLLTSDVRLGAPAEPAIKFPAADPRPHVRNAKGEYVPLDDLIAQIDRKRRLFARGVIAIWTAFVLLLLNQGLIAFWPWIGPALGW